MSWPTSSTHNGIILPPPERYCGLETINTATYGASWGSFLGLAHMAWHNGVPKPYTSALNYVATRTSQAAALGAIFALSSCSLHERFNSSNREATALGGFMSGFAIGIHHRNLGMAVGLGSAFALLGFGYELNGRSIRGPMADLSFHERLHYNTHSFWRNPEMSPIARAMFVIDRAGASERPT